MLGATLVEQIGVEPGPQLRRLHEAILGQDALADLGGPGELPGSSRRAPPLVGRDAELERLREAWARARAGRGAVVVVSGPPGIGRTRLVAELAHEVQREGARVLYGAGAAPSPGTGAGRVSTRSRARPLSWASPRSVCSAS